MHIFLAFVLSPLYFEIHKYWYLKVNYESQVDWWQTTNYLHCSPRFHNHLRQDFVIVHTDDGDPVFVQLLFLFKCSMVGQEYWVALIQPFNEPIPLRDRPKKD